MNWRSVCADVPFFQSAFWSLGRWLDILGGFNWTCSSYARSEGQCVLLYFLYFGRWFDLLASFLSIASSCAWSDGRCVLLYLIWYFGRRFELKASVNLALILCKQFCFEDNTDIFIAIFCFEDKANLLPILFWRPTNRPTRLGIEAPSRSLKI